MKRSHPYYIAEGQHLVLVRGKTATDPKDFKKPSRAKWTEHAPTDGEIDAHLLRGGSIGIIPYSVKLACFDLDRPQDEALVLGRFPHLLEHAVAITNSKTAHEGWQKKHLWVKVSEPWADKSIGLKSHIRCATGQIVLYPGIPAILREALKKDIDDEVVRRNDSLIQRFIDAGGGTTSNYEEGSRNETLFRDACRVLEKSIPFESKRKQLQKLAQAAYVAGLTEDEIRSTIKSAQKRVHRDKKQKAEGQTRGRPYNREKMDQEADEDLEDVVEGASQASPKKKSTNKAVQISNWLYTYHEGVEFIRISSTDSSNTGLQPILWGGGGWRKPDANEVAELIQLEFPSVTSNQIREAMYMLAIKGGKTTSLKQWDQAQRYLGLTGGRAFDFETCKVIKQKKEMRILVSVSTTIKPKTTIKGTFFEKCLKDWMRSPRHGEERTNEKIEILQKIMGYSLQFGNPNNFIFFHVGYGANGKSAFLNVALRAALGNEVLSILPSNVITSKAGSHDSSLAKVVRSRVSVAEEIPNIRRLNTATLKMLSGEDVVTVRNLYQDLREEVCQATIHIPSNFHPSKSMAMTDPSWRRRVVVVPWDFIIPEEDRDVNIAYKLRKESGVILWWILAGWKKYKENDYKIGIQEYMKVSDNEEGLAGYDLNPLKEHLKNCPDLIPMSDVLSIIGAEASGQALSAKLKEFMLNLGYTKKRARIKGKPTWCFTYMEGK